MSPTAFPRLRATVWLGALLAASAGAQTAPTPVGTDVSLAGVLAALRSAPGYRSADLTYRAARQSLDAARASNGLTLSANADYTVGQNPFGSETRGGATVGATASANLLPWSPGADAVRRAERALERAEFDLRDGRAALTLNAAQQYLNARTAALDGRLADARLDLARRSFEAARAQRASGQITQEALLDRQREVEAAQGNAENARRALDLNVRQLFNTLGAPQNALPLNPVFSTAPTEPGAPAPLADLVARAQNRRSEVLRARSSLADAQAGLDIARRDRVLPNLSVTARLGQLGGAGGTSGAVLTGSLNVKSGAGALGLSAPLSGSDLQTGASLALSGSFNILDPAADAQVRSAETGVESAALALDTSSAAVELDVRQQYANLQNALANLPPARTALARANTALDTARAREAAGLGTPLDTAAAELNRQSAERDLDAALAAAALAGLALANATADLDPTLLGGPR